MDDSTHLQDTRSGHSLLPNFPYHHLSKPILLEPPETTNNNNINICPNFQTNHQSRPAFHGPTLAVGSCGSSHSQGSTSGSSDSYLRWFEQSSPACALRGTRSPIRRDLRQGPEEPGGKGLVAAKHYSYLR